MVDNTNDYDEFMRQSSSDGSELNNCASGSSDDWMVLSVSGVKPEARFNHAAAVVGNNIVVVGGESSDGLLDDVQVLSFDRFSWTKVSPKRHRSPTSNPLKIPACKGHTLVPWGKKVLLIGGKTEPACERVTVWAFDMDEECWSLMEAKGDILVARSGHTVVRANSVLILFGGENSKRRKLNDMHTFDLKSLTWLPSSLHTLVFDILKFEWSVAVASPSSSITTNKGFSLVLAQNREINFLVAFGGFKKDASDQVEVLVMEKIESLTLQKTTLSKVAGLLSENHASSVELSSAKQWFSQWSF